MNKAFIAIAAVIVIAAAYYGGYFQYLTGSIVNGCQAPSDSSGMLLVPLMGFYSCEPAQGGQITDNVQISVGNTGAYFSLCTQNTPSCTINYDGNGGTLTFCDSSQVATNSFFGNQYCTTSRTMPTTLAVNSNGLYSRIFVPAASLGSVNANLQRVWTPFTLYQTSPTGGKTQVYQSGTYSCNPPGTAKLCVGDSTNSYCTKGVYTGGLSFYGISNYFDKLVTGPVSANTYTYNGQTVYGSGAGTLYSIGKVTLSDGTCYSVPQSVVANVACLPGAISGGQQCGTDFAWHILPTSTGSTSVAPSCVSDLQCPGGGNYLVDYSDPLRKTAVKYSCQTGQCILQPKVVSSCADTSACPTGAVCSLDPSTGIGACLSSATNPLPGRITGILCPDMVTTVSDASLCPLTSGFDYKIYILAAIGIIGAIGLYTRKIPGMVAMLMIAVAVIGYLYFYQTAYLVLGIIGIVGLILALFFIAPGLLMRGISTVRRFGR